MANSYYHAVSSAKRWGGKADDYIAIHSWFDGSKAFMSDFRHRALRHHTEGIFMAETIFGHTITNSDGRIVPVRAIGEQHVKEDLGWIPGPQDWFKGIVAQKWMHSGAEKLSRTLEHDCVEKADRQEAADEDAGCR